MKKTPGNGSDTRRRILDAAETLFARQGYNGTTTRQIARAAGISIQTLQYHGKGKRNLYHAVLERSVLPVTERIDRYVQKMLERDLTDPRMLEESVTRIIDELFDLLHEHPNYALLFYRQWLVLDADLRSVEWENLVPLFRQWSSEIEAQLDPGRLEGMNLFLFFLSLSWMYWGLFVQPEFISRYVGLAPDSRAYLAMIKDHAREMTLRMMERRNSSAASPFLVKTQAAPKGPPGTAKKTPPGKDRSSGESGTRPKRAGGDPGPRLPSKGGRPGGSTSARSHGNVGRRIAVALSFCLLATPWNPSWAFQAPGRHYEPVEVPGEVLASALGRKAEELSLYALQDGAWRSVVFQIDERTPDGAFVLPEGPEANGDAGDGLLGERDLLVFLARDAGDQAPAGVLPPGAHGVDVVELVDPIRGQSRWAYLTAGKTSTTGGTLPPLCRMEAMDGGGFRFGFGTYGYEALVNEWKGRRTPTILIDRLWVLPEAGGNGANLIDRQKTRGRMSFLGGMVKIRFNESIVQGGLVAYKAGPVRVLTRSRMYPRFPLGIKGPDFTLDSILVDAITLTANTMNVPFNPGHVMHEMRLTLGTDLSPAAEGMTFYNSENLHGFRIDGTMDAAERGFDPTKDRWRVITGPQGTQITCTSFDPGFLVKGKVRTVYSDDASEAAPPERWAGNMGAAFDELEIRSLPAGTYTIEVFGCIPAGFHDPGGLDRGLLDDILRIRSHPLRIRAGGREVENRGTVPRRLSAPASGS